MRYARTLVAGIGRAGTLGGLALCVLIFLSAYLAFDDDRPGVKPRTDSILRLPSVPDAEVPRVPLARPPSRVALPRATPSATAPAQTTPHAPAGGSSPLAVDTLTPPRPPER